MKKSYIFHGTNFSGGICVLILFNPKFTGEILYTEASDMGRWTLVVIKSLSVTESQKYTMVKAVILTTYKLVPEAYRQRFRTWRKHDKQTHLEFARDLTAQFMPWCLALKVETFDKLCDLIVLEQFKNSIPENIATYINNQKVKTAAEAAAVADDYVLMHRRNLGFLSTRDSGFGGHAETSYNPVNPSRSDMKDRSMRNLDKTCNFCNKKGHFKADCYALKARTLPTGTAQPRGACLAVPVPKLSPVVNDVQEEVPLLGKWDSFLLFVSNDFVSLAGSDVKIPVKISCDTAAFDSLIHASVLPFSEKSDTGCTVPVVGMGMKILQVPLHDVMLYSELFQGKAAVGVCLALPLEGITLILGNGVAGARVWAAVPPPPPVVSSVPLVSK